MSKLIDSFTFYLFIFSLLYILKYVIKIISFLLGKDLIVATNRELIFIFLFISYILTYLIKL
jgi:hypothetical protein